MESFANGRPSTRSGRHFSLWFNASGLLRRGGRVVECTALEMRRAREGTEGSNPSLSANFFIKPLF